MKLYKRKKILFLILAACIVLSIVLAEFFFAHDHEHEHSGSAEGCFICLHIESLLKALKMTALLLCTVHILIFQYFNRSLGTDLKILSLSPIILKDRINS